MYQTALPDLILITTLHLGGQSQAITQITQRALLTWSFFLSLALWSRIAIEEGWDG